MANEYAVNQADLTAVANAIREKGETAAQLVFPDDFVTAIGNISTGVELNFEVVGGTTQPSNPKENTIWINTDTEITGWAFSATEPTEPVEGMVWIQTSGTGAFEFNALKDNTLEVCVVSAKQYVGGVWEDMENVMSYQNGEWKEWILYLFNNGDKCTDITGGWSADGFTAGSGVVAATFETDHIKMYGTAGINTMLRTNKKIDFAGYKTLTINAEVISTLQSYSAFYARLFSAIGGIDVNVIAAKGAGATAGKVTMQIPLEGIESAYVGFYVGGDIKYQSKIYSILLE